MLNNLVKKTRNSLRIAVKIRGLNAFCRDKNVELGPVRQFLSGKDIRLSNFQKIYIAVGNVGDIRLNYPDKNENIADINAAALEQIILSADTTLSAKKIELSMKKRAKLYVLLYRILKPGETNISDSYKNHETIDNVISLFG